MTPAPASHSFPGNGAAPPRFALALAASALAHLYLVQALVFEVPQRAARPVHARMMSVRIAAPAPPVTAAPALPPVAPRIETGAPGVDRGHPAAMDAHSQRDPVAPLALPQAPDPTFYSARDLDVFPRPAVPLDLDRLGARDAGSAAGKFGVVLLIDESGAVGEIAIAESGPRGRLQEELRAALAATRFFPGQKNGRAVKSRVVLSVILDPARAESAADR